MGTIWQQPSPSDFDRWVALLIDGVEPSAAAKQLGFTCSAFRRTDAAAHAEALEISREARAGYADERAEEWANEPGADHRMRELWLARWNAAYRRAAQLEVSGSMEVRSDISASLDRLNEILAAAAVRAAAGSGAELVPGQPERAGAGRPRLAVAGVDGETEPARATG